MIRGWKLREPKLSASSPLKSADGDVLAGLRRAAFNDQWLVNTKAS